MARQRYSREGKHWWEPQIFGVRGGSREKQEAQDMEVITWQKQQGGNKYGVGEDSEKNGLAGEEFPKQEIVGLTSGRRLDLKTQLEDLGHNVMATGSYYVFWSRRAL